MKMAKTIIIKVNNLKTNPEDVYLKKVIPSGNGAVIPFFKEFIGKEVYVIIKRKQ